METLALVAIGLYLLSRKKAPGPAKPLTVVDRMQATRLTGFAVTAPTYQKWNVPSLESIRYGAAAGKAIAGGGAVGGGGAFTPPGGKQQVG